MFSAFILQKVYEFFVWILDVLKINELELPADITVMTTTLMHILTDACEMFAWLFPPVLWTAMINLTCDVFFIMLNMKFLKWGLNMYNKIRGK